MAEIERTRVRERPPLREDAYETAYRYRKEQAERQMNGPVVIRSEDREVFLSRQGRLTFLLDPLRCPRRRSITGASSRTRFARSRANIATRAAWLFTYSPVSATRSSRANASTGKKAVCCCCR